MRNNQRLLTQLRGNLLADFETYARRTKLIFVYVYADTPQNQRLGRVGRRSGFRTGTQNLDYIPFGQLPRGRNSNTTAERYYDLRKQAWRAFRKRDFVVITAFWDERRQQYFPTAEEAGLEGRRRFRFEKTPRKPANPERMKRYLERMKRAKI